MNLKFLKDDFKPSIIVFLVALPLCLGIALASEAPLFSGLLAGIIGGIVVGFLSDSHLSVSGPAAGLTAIIAGSISQLGSFEAFTVAVLLAGIIQIILGLIKGGNIGDYFSNSVIRGMLAGIGVIIIFKQKNFLLGITEKIAWIHPQDILTQIHPGVAFIGIFSLGVLLLWKRLEDKNVFFKIIPGGLFVVIAGACLNEVFSHFLPHLHLDQYYLVNLQFEGGFNLFLEKLSFPEWTALKRWDVYKVALTIAVVASLESLLSLDAADNMDTKKRISSKNRELVAQGVGNLLAGFVGAIPITAVIVRTTANASSGAQTRSSAIMHGIWLVLCVTIIPSILDLIPLASLAAILITVGFKLTPISLYRKMFSLGKSQSLPFIVTVVAITFIDLLSGVLLGMGVSFFFLIRSTLDGPVHLYEENGTKIIRFMKDASFLNKSLLGGILHAIPDGSTVVIDSVSPVKIDRDIILLFEDFLASSKQRNITVKFKKLSISNYDFFKL